MKPITVIPCFAIRTPGQKDRAREILNNQPFDFTEHEHGLFTTNDITAKDAFTVMMPIWLGISLTNAIHFSAHKSLEDAINSARPRSTTGMTNSGIKSIDSLTSLTQFMADNPELLVAQPDEIIYVNPDVTESEWMEATASAEYQLAFKYRHSDMRQTLGQDELNQIWQAYATKYPNVSKHDPKWSD